MYSQGIFQCPKIDLPIQTKRSLQKSHTIYLSKITIISQCYLSIRIRSIFYCISLMVLLADSSELQFSLHLTELLCGERLWWKSFVSSTVFWLIKKTRTRPGAQLYMFLTIKMKKYLFFFLDIRKPKKRWLYIGLNVIHFYWESFHPYISIYSVYLCNI